MPNPRFIKKAEEWKNKEPPKERTREEEIRPTIKAGNKGVVKGSFSDHKEFYGKNTDKMPELIADGRVPMSVYDLMVKRLEVLTDHNADSDERNYFLNNYFDTGDGILYKPQDTGGIIIVPDAQALREMNSNSTLVNGALNLERTNLNGINGTEFSKQNLEIITIGRHLTLDDAKNHPIWLALARGDKELLKGYSEALFKHAKEKHDFDTNMGIYLGSNQEVPSMRAWLVGRAGSGSCAGGGGSLRGGGGRSVGLASETQKT